MRPAESSLPLVALLALAACGSGTAESPLAAPSPAPSSSAESGPGAAGETTVIQPGAPGQASRTVDATDLSVVDEVEYSPHDVRFMQGMIPHHAQALEMTALVEQRTTDPGFRRLALRMEISQRDEIQLMSRWLEARGESVPNIGTHAAHHGPMMPGMLSAEQMQQLQASEGVEFETLFLEFMIQHHEGAIQMVRDLFASQGGGQASEVFQFANDVDVDQRMEIERMQRMLTDRR